MESQVFPKPFEVISSQLALKSLYSTVTPDQVAVMYHFGFPVNRDQFSGDVQCDCCCLFTANLNGSPCVKAAAIEFVENSLQPFRLVTVNKTRAVNRSRAAFVLEIVLDGNPCNAVMTSDPMQGLGPFATTGA